mmetsp:Transcript_12602/g.18524  ORF Transcript_12602/g.18524 Transcript_12602/m.18524 type:complete len:116 (-) Transcript_12602:193-540(-)
MLCPKESNKKNCKRDCNTNNDCIDGGIRDQTCISLGGKSFGVTMGLEVGVIGAAGWSSTDGSDAVTPYGFSIGGGPVTETCTTKHIVAGCLDENEEFQRDLDLVRPSSWFEEGSG